MEWIERNCGNCHKMSEGQGTCQIEDAIYDGLITGTVPQSIEERRKDVDDCCPELEREPTVDPGPELPL
jgi:hypothetical protein